MIGLAADRTDSILPIFQSVFLLFSVISYRFYLTLQHFCTAYLIVFFENQENFGFETSYSQVFFEKKGKSDTLVGL